MRISFNIRGLKLGFESTSAVTLSTRNKIENKDVGLCEGDTKIGYMSDKMVLDTLDSFTICEYVGLLGKLKEKG